MILWVRDEGRKGEERESENVWAGPGLKFDPKVIRNRDKEF